MFTCGVFAVRQVARRVRRVPPCIAVVFVGVVMMRCQREAAAIRKSCSGGAQRPAWHKHTDTLQLKGHTDISYTSWTVGVAILHDYFNDWKIHNKTNIMSDIYLVLVVSLFGI